MAGRNKLADTTKENRAAEESWAAEKSWDTEESWPAEEDWADPKLQLDQKWSREEYCQQPECWAETPRPTSQKQSREEYCQQPEHWAGTPRPGRPVYWTATRRRMSVTRALGETFKNRRAISLRGMANQQPTHVINLKPNRAALLGQPGSQREKQSKGHMKVY